MHRRDENVHDILSENLKWTTQSKDLEPGRRITLNYIRNKQNGDVAQDMASIRALVITIVNPRIS
jgi:hypothetical protein